MPKTLYVSKSVSVGIDITFTPSTGQLYIGGWYDSCVGIQPETMSLADFFRRLGITEKDCRKALKERTA